MGFPAHVPMFAGQKRRSAKKKSTRPPTRRSHPGGFAGKTAELIKLAIRATSDVL
jgi:hypothetical protein